MLNDGRLFKKIKEYDELGYIMSCASKGLNSEKEGKIPSSRGGLVPGHSYSLIQVKEIDD